METPARRCCRAPLNGKEQKEQRLASKADADIMLIAADSMDISFMAVVIFVTLAYSTRGKSPVYAAAKAHIIVPAQ